MPVWGAQRPPPPTGGFLQGGRCRPCGALRARSSRGGGGGGGGGGGPGWSGGAGGGPGRLLQLTAGLCVASSVAAAAAPQAAHAAREPSPAALLSADVERLRRLTRDVFREQLESRRRLKVLEEQAGLALPFSVASGGEGGAPSPSALRLSARLSTRLQLPCAPPRTGTTLEVSAEAPLRAALGEWVSLRASADVELLGDAAAGGRLEAPSFRLTRLVYRLRPTARTRLLCVAVGCEGGDCAPTLNPAHGVAASQLARQGSAAHGLLARHPGGGALLAASYEAGRLSVSLAGRAPHAARAALAQLTWRPQPRVALALTAARSGSERALGGAACCVLGGWLTLSGWAAATARRRADCEWALAMAPAPGASHAPGWGCVAGRPLGGAPQLEAFLVCAPPAQQGWAATPGLLLVRGQTPRLVVHAQARF